MEKARPDLYSISMKLFNKTKTWTDNQENMFYIFLTILIAPNIALCFTEHMSLLAKVTNIIFPLSIYHLIMSRFKNCGTAFWILFPFIFLGAFQIVLLYLFGKSIIAVDMFLNLVTTNSSEAMELLNNLLPALVTIVILYIPALVIAAISIIRKKTLSTAFIKREQKRSIITLLTGVICLLSSSFTDKRYQIEEELYPANVCYNIFLATQRTAWTNNYKSTSKEFTYKARATHNKKDKEIYVMVVGETSRACNWSLYGYSRNTNPRLEEYKNLTAFSHVLSESNTTHKSVPMLISSVSATNYDSIYYRKGIITAFKEAGFHTSFFSNQRRNHSFIDFFGMEADEYDFIKEDSLDTKHNPYDLDLLKLVSKTIDKGYDKQLIVLHTYGSHFSYRERYPKDEAFFIPDAPAEAEARFKNNLYNGYDNTIRYTDKFLAELIDIINRPGTDAALIYTSDHGEDIFDDDRKLFLHASPVPSYYQIHVPFIVWTSDSYMEKYPEKCKAMDNNKSKDISSSLSFFHTMLDLSGVDTPYRNDSHSVSSQSFKECRRVYLNDHNEARTLDDIGMDEEDFYMLKSSNIGNWP